MGWTDVCRVMEGHAPPVPSCQLKDTNLPSIDVDGTVDACKRNDCFLVCVIATAIPRHGTI